MRCSPPPPTPLSPLSSLGSSSACEMPPLFALNLPLSGLQVHPHRGSGQRVPRGSGARGRDHGPGAAAGGPAVELPGSGGAGGTLRPGEQPAQSGFHGVHVARVRGCDRGGPGLSQLGKRSLLIHHVSILSMDAVALALAPTPPRLCEAKPDLICRGRSEQAEMTSGAVLNTDHCRYGVHLSLFFFCSTCRLNAGFIKKNLSVLVMMLF